MRLENPLWLLLTLLVLLLAWLHRQRRAHRVAEVGSLHLWRRLAVEHAPNRSRQLPRLSVSLLLQLLVLLLLALALARPAFGNSGDTDTGNTGTGGVLLLIDASRAMQATDVQPSRFQAATSSAANLLSGRVSVLLVSERPLVLAAARRDTQAVRRDLLAARPGDGLADWNAAASAARALLASAPGTRVVAFAAPSTAAQAKAALAGLTLTGPEVRTLGGPLSNAALTRLIVTPALTGKPWTVNGAARLYGKGQEATGRTLTFRLDSQTLAVQTLALQPGQDTPFALSFTPGTALPVGGGVLTVSLSPDALMADDTAQLVLRPRPAALRVAVVGPQIDEVERGLAALPGVTVSHATGLNAEADLLVVTQPSLQRSGLQGAAQRPTLWLNAAAGPNGLDVPSAWDARSPLGRGVRWADLTVGSPVSSSPAGNLAPWPESLALLSGTRGPLIEQRGTGARWEVRVNFPVLSGNWTQTPAFPTFLSNVARQLRPDAGMQVVTPCTVGEPCALSPGTASLTTPDGQAQPVIGDTFLPMRAGVYRVGGVPLAVNRLAGLEANLSASTAGSGAGEGGPTGGSFSSLLDRLSGWTPLLLLGLLLLLTEGVMALRAEPALRTGGWRRWRTLPRATRQMLALHALATLLLLLALLDVPLPSPGREQAAAIVRLPGTTAGEALRPQVQVWGTPSPTLSAPSAAQTPEQRSAHPAAGDLAAALETAAAALPADTERSILLTAGRWPTSAALPDVLAGLRARGIRVNAVQSGPGTPLELLTLEVPTFVDSGQPFAAQAVLNATVPTRARVTLRRGDELLIQRELRLPTGFTRLTLPLRETRVGTVGYTLTVQGETALARGTVTSQVQAAPRVAVIGNDAAAQGVVVRALATQGLTGVPLTPASVTADSLAGYRSVLLLDVAARSIGADVRRALDGYVRGGGHLLIGGGPSSYGAGGYLGTALEDLSPLSSRVQRDAPRIALGLVLDKSGSMNEEVGRGVTKLDLIKAAALSASGLLHPQSDVAVIAFDTSPKVAVPLQRASDQKTIRAQISRIEAEGGTVVLRALEASLKQLAASKASRKHMILLTDGIDGGIFNPDEYRQRVRRIRASGVTVSTVSVGSGMHVPLMRSIAEWGEGTFSVTQDWNDVPSLLAQDTLSQGLPAVAVGSAALRWQDDLSAASTVGGFVRTSLKPGATLLANTGDSAGKTDPLAASWRLGLGSVTALSTQLAGGWANVWTARADYPATLAFLTRPASVMADSVQSGTESGTAQPQLLRGGNDLLVRSTVPRVTLSGPAGPVTLDLHPVSSGSGYAAQLLAPLPGGYTLGGTGQSAAAGVLSAVTRRELPALVAEATGGRVLASPALLPSGQGWQWKSAWTAFTLLALASFLLGLACRYLLGQGNVVVRPSPTSDHELA